MDIFVKCPHCHGGVEVIAINCAIFRHGVFIASKTQMDPHTPKVVCDEVARAGLIYGCGKPFRVVAQQSAPNTPKTYVAVDCGYI